LAVRELIEQVVAGQQHELPGPDGLGPIVQPQGQGKLGELRLEHEDGAIGGQSHQQQADLRALSHVVEGDVAAARLESR
jgi:hypothetical protein